MRRRLATSGHGGATTCDGALQARAAGMCRRRAAQEGTSSTELVRVGGAAGAASVSWASGQWHSSMAGGNGSCAKGTVHRTATRYGQKLAGEARCSGSVGGELQRHVRLWVGGSSGARGCERAASFGCVCRHEFRRACGRGLHAGLAVMLGRCRRWARPTAMLGRVAAHCACAVSWVAPASGGSADGSPCGGGVSQRWCSSRPVAARGRGGWAAGFKPVVPSEIFSCVYYSCNAMYCNQHLFFHAGLS